MAPSDSKRTLSKTKTIALPISLVVAALVSWFAQPLVHDNGDAQQLLGTLFSILAAFSLAIATFLVDPSMFPSRLSVVAAEAKKTLRKRLQRHQQLFLAYLATLTLILAATLLKSQSETVVLLLEHAYLFVGTVALFFSFLLPAALQKIQEERLDSWIDARHDEEKRKMLDAVGEPNK